MLSTSYVLIVELSRNEKLQKYRIILSFCYLHKWLIHFLTCLLLPYIFFSAIFLHMCKPRTTFYLFWWACLVGLAFYERGLACLPSCLRMMNADWLGSMWSESFLQMKFNNFQGFFTKQVAFLPGQPTRYNEYFIQPLLLVPEWCFA